MKNLQTGSLKFHLLTIFFFLALAASSQSSSIVKADSLFKSKRYTQSFDIYQSLLQQGKYSPAMLLKMAYIQEGLGNIGHSLYCLRLYQLATDDYQAMEKMQELAAKFNLTGYDETDSNILLRWMDKNLLFIESALIFCILIFAGITSILKRKNKTIYFPITLAGLFCFGVLYLNNFVSIPSVITSENKVYLMEGPSAGASVSGIVSSGNQLQVLGKEDVWLKVKWMDKKVFVKESSVLHVNL